MSVISVARYLRAWLGIAVAIAAGAAFAIANTSAGVAYQAGSNPLTVASTRFLLPTAALIAWLSLTGVSLVLPKRQAFVAILLGAVTALYNWALLRSFNLIPFALAVLIIYLYPLIAAVIVTGFGWDKFAWRTGAAIVVAFIGLAFALDVRGGNLDISGVSLAFVAAVGLAVVVAVSSRVFGNGDARPVTFYMSAAASILLLLLGTVSGDFAFPQTNAGWISFVAAAVFYGLKWLTPAMATAPDQSGTRTITIGAFDAFVTFARLRGVALRMVAGSGQNGKDEEDCARTCSHGHAGGKGEREVQRPPKRRRASNRKLYALPRFMPSRAATYLRPVR